MLLFLLRTCVMGDPPMPFMINGIFHKLHKIKSGCSMVSANRNAALCRFSVSGPQMVKQYK